MGGGCPWDHYQSCITPHHTGTSLALPLFLVPISALLVMFKLVQLLSKCRDPPGMFLTPVSKPSTDIPNLVQILPHCSGPPTRHDMAKLVHYEAYMVGKQAVGILLELLSCLLLKKTIYVMVITTHQQSCGEVMFSLACVFAGVGYL